MWKKRMLCLGLVLCAVILTGCQQKETFPTTDQLPQATATAVSDAQNLFGSTPIPTEVNFDDGSYDPTAEEGGGEELTEVNGPTPTPFMQSEYAGATPVLIDPIDKPTPTPLPALTFTYATYEAPALHLTFEAPAGWMVDDSQPDTYTLTNPDPSMDYAAQLSIRAMPVSNNYSKNDLTKEVKGMLDTLASEGFKNFDRSNTATRTFMNSTAVYANYTATTMEGVHVAGRVIIACNNRTLYILHVSYPQGYTRTYVDGVYDRFRHTVKITTASAQ